MLNTLNANSKFNKFIFKKQFLLNTFLKEPKNNSEFRDF